MRALDRKLWRDLRQLWSQALTIALVVASGVGGFLTTLSAVDSLDAARERFYAQARFADLFASVKRAPESLTATLAAVPGVAAVQTTLEELVRLRRPGSDEALLGQLIGLDLSRPQRLNQLVLRSGRVPGAQPHADGGLEVLVSEAFATAHGLGPGDRLVALVNGRERPLVVTGIALSPEFIFAGLWGMPDQRGFGVFWMEREPLAAAYDMRGAFNRLQVQLAPGADAPPVQAALAAALRRHGGHEVLGREHQSSHAMLDNEIKEQRLLGTVLPLIFLAVAAFLLNVVVSRLVATQREQIAALKALGYPDGTLVRHYLALVGLIVAAGLVLGVVLGDRLGGMLTGLYAEFFRFPAFAHRLDPVLVLAGAGITVLTAAAGTLGAIRATVRLSPAQAMHPPAPGQYRRTVVERLGLRGLSPALRMILRQMERRPWRTTLSIAGVAAAVAIVIMGNFFRDAIDLIVDTQFRLAMRADAAVWLAEPGPARAGQEVARLPGVLEVEALRDVGVSLVNGHRRERAFIRGMPAEPALNRIIEEGGRLATLPGDGLVLTDRLASKLGLRVGDTVRVEVLEGEARVLMLPVQATVREMMGLNAYMARDALNRALGDDDLASGYWVGLERGREAAFSAAIRELPRVAGSFSKASMLANMEAISARNVRIMSTVLTLFATVIAVGVVYNNARIALAERTWEFASLRVLGLTRAEVSALLLGELALSIALALPLGMVMGWALVHGLAGALASDQFLFPVVIRPRTYAWAAIAVVAAGLASGWVVRRRIDRLDLVAALKTRE
jgi:putative ABC transport system permease protein